MHRPARRAAHGALLPARPGGEPACTTGAPPRPPCGASPSGRRSSGGSFVLDGGGDVAREVSSGSTTRPAARCAGRSRSCRGWTWRSIRPPRSGPPAAGAHRFTRHPDARRARHDRRHRALESRRVAGGPAAAVPPHARGRARDLHLRGPAARRAGPRRRRRSRAVARDAAGRRYDDRRGDGGLPAHPPALAISRPAAPTVQVAPLAAAAGRAGRLRARRGGPGAGGARRRRRSGDAARRRDARARRPRPVRRDRGGTRAYETDPRWSRATGGCSTTRGGAGCVIVQYQQQPTSTAGSRPIR